MTHNVVHLGGHCKNLMKLSRTCVGIEPSKNPNAIKVFLGWF